MANLSDYELLALFTTYGTDSGGHFMNFLAVFSAYLVAGYMLAGKLGRITLLFLSVLLVLVTMMTALGQYVVQLVATDLAADIVSRKLELGPNVVAAARLFSGENAQYLVCVSPAIQFLACFGAIFFAHGRARSATRVTYHQIEPERAQPRPDPAPDESGVGPSP